MSTRSTLCKFTEDPNTDELLWTPDTKPNQCWILRLEGKEEAEKGAHHRKPSYLKKLLKIEKMSM